MPRMHDGSYKKRRSPYPPEGWGKKSHVPGRSPATHWGGTVLVFRLSTSPAAFLRVSQAVKGLSYSLRKINCAFAIRSAASACSFPTAILPRTGHTNCCVSPGPKCFGPCAGKYTSCSITPVCGALPSARKQTKSQYTVRLETENKPLLFVPLKETSNAEPKEGTPATKVGATGHGGPQKVYIPPN